MADIRKRILVLSTGKQIKLFGTCIGIAKTLEVGEVYAPNILSAGTDPKEGKIANPYLLSQEELMEIADLNIRLWVELKENLRKFGLDKKIFTRE